MNTKKLIVLCLLLLTVHLFVFSQEKINPQLLDRFGEICSEDFMARYDNLLLEIQSNKDSKAHILFYGNETKEGKNLEFIKMLTGYGRTRLGDLSRIKIVRGGNEEVMLTEFWVVKDAGTLPKVNSDFVSPIYKETTRFDVAWADFHKTFDGKKAFYGDDYWSLGCYIPPNLEKLSSILKSNPTYKLHLIIYNSKPRYSTAIGKYAVKELVSKYKIPRKRIMASYLGEKKEPQIEFWIVPENGESAEKLSRKLSVKWASPNSH